DPIQILLWNSSRTLCVSDTWQMSGTNDLFALLVTNLISKLALTSTENSAESPLGVNPFTKQNFYSKEKARKMGKWPGGLGDTKSNRATNWQDSGIVVSFIRIPGSHGPGIPETREANVKCTDKTEGNI
ncbi:hypothetical protein Prudu_014775, partial [Prunus dulcis]